MNMNALTKQAVVVGGGPLAMILALKLHRQGIVVTLAGEAPPINPPLNPELMLIGGDDSMSAVFQKSLQEWRNLGKELGLMVAMREVEAQDLATTQGRVSKLRDEAMLDVLGGESVSYVEGTSRFVPLAKGYKLWRDAPLLGADTLQLLQKAIASEAIVRITANPVALSVATPGRPQVTLDNGKVLQGDHLIFTSARALRRLLPPLGLALPLRPARGHVMMLETAKPHGLPLLLQRLRRGHLFIVPMGPGRVDVHYDAINDPAQATFNSQHSTSLVTALQQHVATLVPALAGASLLGVATSREWLTPDYLPALGPWPGLPGVLVGTGWGGRGTAYAAGAAAMLADSIVQDSHLIDIPSLAPNRFANGLWQVVKQPGSLNWAEPVEERDNSMLSIKPDYMETVNMVEPPKAQYASNVQQVGKTITENAGRRATTLQTKERRKIVTASIKST